MKEQKFGAETNYEYASIHKEGGLGKVGWGYVLEKLDQNPPAQQPLIPGQLREYAQAVVDGMIDDSNFEQRKYLDRGDLTIAINALHHSKTLKGTVSEIFNRREKYPFSTEIEHFLTFEKARARSLRDYVNDEVGKRFHWDPQSNRWLVNDHDTNPFYDNSFFGGDQRPLRPLGRKEIQQLGNMFVSNRDRIETIPPLELYQNLYEIVKQTPIVEDSLVGKPSEEWRQLYVGTLSTRDSLGRAVQNGYKHHFGPTPTVSKEMGCFKVVSQDVREIHNPFLMQPVPKKEGIA